MPGTRTDRDAIPKYGFKERTENSPKDIRTITSSRRLNEYTIIPRRPRAHPQNPQDYVPTNTIGTHGTVVEPVVDYKRNNDCSIDTIIPPGSSQDKDLIPEKRDRSYSFKRKLRKLLLGRSKSLNKDKDEKGEETLAKKGDQDTKSAGVLFSSSPPNPSGLGACLTTPRLHRKQNKGDKYSVSSIKTKSDRDLPTEISQDNSSGSGSGSNSSMASMAVGLHTRVPVCSIEQPETKGSVLKSLSSLSIRNLSNRKKASRKPKHSPVKEANSSEENLEQNHYRGSFKQVSQRDNSQIDIRCQRSKSFTDAFRSADVQQPMDCNPLPSDPYNNGSSDRMLASSNTEESAFRSQTAENAPLEYETKGGEMIYSLAKSDTPPPLPERTYLKLRNTAYKENKIPSGNTPIQPPQHGYDSKGRSVTFTDAPEQNDHYKTLAAYASQVRQLCEPQYQRPHPGTGTSPRPQASGYIITNAKPFLLHRDCDQYTLSSGYGSGASDSLSMGSDYYRMPPPPPPVPMCTLPKRSRHLSASAQPQASRLASHYSNSESERERKSESSSSSSQSEESPAQSRKSDESDETVSDCTLTRTKVHNLPLPPGPGGARLVKTIHLNGIMKDKWISGVAVTRKNEYLVVDERRAYLLDEDGNLKKNIGVKGSGKLIKPLSVAVMPSTGNLVIGDHAEQDVKVFNWKGQFLSKVRDPSLTNIAGVAATAKKDIVIAGTDKKIVSVLSEDNQLRYTIPPMPGPEGTFSRTRSPFEHPYSVAVNSLTGDIIIGDDYKQVVTAISPSDDGSSCRILWRYCPGPGDRHFFPSAICADSNGYIFIADLYNAKVDMLDSSGKFVKTLLSRGDGLKGGPGALATDGRGHLLVADEERILKVFRYGNEDGFAVNRRYSYCPEAT